MKGTSQSLFSSVRNSQKYIANSVKIRNIDTYLSPEEPQALNQ
jgi:hypothetical protein